MSASTKTSANVSGGDEGSQSPQDVPFLKMTNLPDCEPEVIKNAVENVAGEKLLDLEVDEKNHVAYVVVSNMDALSNVFIGPPVIHGTETRCEIYGPESYTEACETVLEVLGVKSSVTEESIWLYFEKESGSGERQVAAIEVDYATRRALVKFYDKDAARSVANKGRHIINGVKTWSAYPENPEEIEDKLKKLQAAYEQLSGGKMVNEVGSKQKVQLRHQKDGAECLVWGVCSLPDGGWVVCDFNNKALKRLDNRNNIVDRYELSGSYLAAVCYMPDTDRVAVARGKGRTVDIISLGGRMEHQTSIQTKHHCYGVAVTGEMLYITADGGCEVYEYKLTDQTLQRKICPLDPEGEKRFSSTQYITVSEDGSRLFVTDLYKGLFILDTRTGNVLHEVEAGGFAGDVCLGEDGGLFVAVWYPYKIIHLDRNGTTLGTVVTQEMMKGLLPWIVSYHRNTARLAVSGLKSCDYMFVFHMK